MHIVVCGIGNAERGDDAFGPYIVGCLQECEMLEKIDCGLHTENYLNRIVSSAPDVVIFLDTIDRKSQGCILLRNEEIVELSTLSVSTHSLSMGAIYEFLRNGGVQNVFFLGIPAISYERMTARVKDTADRIIGVLNNIDTSQGVGIIEVYEALSEQIR